jgi:hypothetical protein
MNIKRYLPSKKVQIAIVIILVASIGYAVFLLVQKNYKPTSDQVNYINVQAVTDSENLDTSQYRLDTDNDGAYDWEEALWPELDPNNPDSDDDGVLDGKYIQAKKAIQERERRGIDTPESDLTHTQKFGRGALTALLAIQQSGGEITPETQAQFSENLVQYVSELTLGDKIYTRDELLLVDDTKENTHAYMNSMKKLFQAYPVATSDIELIVSAVENAEEYKGRARSIQSKYEAYLTELTSLEVPYLIASRHTELVNNVSQIAAAAKNLAQDTDAIDDLISLSVVIQLEKILNTTAEAIIKINTFFEIISTPNIFPEVVEG